MVHVGAIQPVPQWWTGTVPDNQSTAGAAIWKPGFKQRQLHLILTANLRKLGYFEGNLLLTHYIVRSILWAIPWNQIKQCFIVVYLLICTSLTEVRHFTSCLSQNILQVSQVFYFTGDSPGWQPCIFPKTCEALSKQPNSAFKATAAELLGAFLFQQITSHIWFPESCPYLPNLSLLMHHWDGLSVFWSTISSRYLLNRWKSHAVLWAQKKSTTTSHHKLQSNCFLAWPCYGHCIT